MTLKLAVAVIIINLMGKFSALQISFIEKFPFRFLFALLIVFTAGQIGLSQKSILIGDLTQGSATNLTNILEAACDQKIARRVGDWISLEVRHDRRSVELARRISVRLESSLDRVTKIIGPEAPIEVRVLIARVDRVPATYEVLVPKGVDFVYPIVYDSSTNLDLDCDGITKLCETVYTTIPHELTHHLLEGKLSNDATWLNEGLAEYVGGLVGSELSPRQAFKRQGETLPEVSLGSPEIRGNLFQWSYTPETLNEESILQYGAAHQLVRLIVAESERKKVKEPLQKLLVFLRARTKIVTSAEAIDFIIKDLGLDPRTLGVLDRPRRDEIFAKAIETFWLERNSKRTAYKYNSLVTFAYLDSRLPDALLVALVEEVFNKKNSKQFACLSAKALSSRIDQSFFEVSKIAGRLNRLRTPKFTSYSSLSEYLLNICRK